MKKILVSVMAFLVAFGPLALAQPPEEVDPGITPDSPAYGLDVAFDRITYLISLNKTATGLRIAKERIAENKKMIRENKPEMAKKAMKHARAMMEKVRQRGKRIPRAAELKEKVKLPPGHSRTPGHARRP